jgi:Protein of unknown function (DUF4230)
MSVDPNLKRARAGLVGFAALWAGVVLALIVIWGVVRGAQKWPGGVLSSWLRRTTHTDMSQPTVVDRIQKLQRLETVVYTMDKIVTGEKQSEIFPDFLAGDRLLMLVHGEVIAGIDFATLKVNDVHVKDRTVRVHLPQAQVLVTRLDSGKTRVYSRQTGWLVPTDPNLETQVRAEAEKELLQAELADGILQKAQENARATITSLMQGMGFVDVGFE